MKSNSITPSWQNILDLLSDQCPHTTSEIAAHLGKTLTATSNVVTRMVNRGMIVRSAYGAFTLPGVKSSAAPVAATADQGVYLLRCGTYYKIGMSDNVAWRVQQLSVALPMEVQHVHTIRTDDPARLEKELHTRFADKRVRGEWFSLDLFDVDELCHYEPAF